MAALPVFPCRTFLFFFSLWARLCQGLSYCLFWGNRNWFQSKSDKMALHLSTGNYHLKCQTASKGLRAQNWQGGVNGKHSKEWGIKQRLFFKNAAPYHLQKNFEWSHFLLCLTCKECHVGHFPFLWQSGKLRQCIQHWVASCSKKSLREGHCCKCQLGLTARGTRGQSPGLWGGERVQAACSLPHLRKEAS